MVRAETGGCNEGATCVWMVEKETGRAARCALQHQWLVYTHILFIVNMVSVAKQLNLMRWNYEAQVRVNWVL